MVRKKYVTYDLKKNKSIVYRGFTNNPKRRIDEHKISGKKFTHMRVTSKKISRNSANLKENKLLAIYRKNHKGKNPRYNQTNNG